MLRWHVYEHVLEFEWCANWCRIYSAFGHRHNDFTIFVGMVADRFCCAENHGVCCMWRVPPFCMLLHKSRRELSVLLDHLVYSFIIRPPSRWATALHSNRWRIQVNSFRGYEYIWNIRLDFWPAYWSANWGMKNSVNISHGCYCIGSAGAYQFIQPNTPPKGKSTESAIGTEALCCLKINRAWFSLSQPYWCAFASHSIMALPICFWMR